MKKDGSSGSLRLKSSPGSPSRAVSWLNFSSLSRQTKRLFRSDGELSVCGQQVEVDDENWTYRTQPRKAVSNLDEESRWTVHYTAPWHQQENVFLPTTRPPCVEDLHRQAKLNLKSVLRECDQLRQDGSRSSQYYSQGPTFAASSSPLAQDDQDEEEESDQKGSISSSEEERLISIRRPQMPTSSDFSDLNTQTSWAKSLPLPTPEEKMRQQAQAVQADVVPINVTGENFDRQASLRRSLIYTDTLVRRPKKVKRRKTIAGVPDSIQKELALGTGQDDGGGPSVYTPDHYSSLGRLGSYGSAGQRLETRDSSCQTEEVRVVPPSMRRIRAQKGQGIAAQMGHFSGSSGNMSVLSDSAGIVFPSRLNHEAGFRSLPRCAARASAQSLEPRLGALGPADSLDGVFPYERDDPQVEGNSGHLGGASRTGTLLRPRSQELRHFEGENLTSPACVVSPHAAYSTSIIPNATLSCSSEVIVIHAVPCSGPLDSRSTSSSSHTKIKSRDRLLSRRPGQDDRLSPSGSWNEGHSSLLQALGPHSPSAATLLSLCDSAVSLKTPAHLENGSPGAAFSCRNKLGFPALPQDADGGSEPSYSGGRAPGGAEPWECSASGKPRAATPGYSSPVSNLSSCSLDQTSSKDDAGSLYAGDHDGYYASVHPDSGRGPADLCSSGDSFGNPRHSVVNVFDERAQKSQGDRSHYHDKSLSRSISLKKAKKPPLPPSRTDSLRRMPRKGTPGPGQALNGGPRASPPHALRLDLGGAGGSSSSQSPCSDADEPWLPRSRSQSTVSAGSSGASATTPTASSLCGAAHSDTSSSRSEGAEPWPQCADGPGAHGDAGAGGAPAGGARGWPVHGGCGAVGAGCSVAAGSRARRVTSPSSGYSSQSNTPPALTPVPALLKAKAKPRVPERKSSLVSSGSLSASSTSLSSSTSADGGGSARTPASALPFPPPPFPPPPPLAETPEGALRPQSPLFPPPPPHLLPPCPPTVPGPLLLESSAPAVPPPAPPLDPKLLEDAQPPFRDSGRAEPPREARRRPPDQEEGRPPPLITREALRTVQLRPVRTILGPEAAPSCGQGPRGKLMPASPQDRGKPPASPKSRNSASGMQSESTPACVPGSRSTPAGSPGGGRGDPGDPGAGPGPSPSRKPPPIAKKPRLVLMVPPPQRQLSAPGPPGGEAGRCAAGAGPEETAAASASPRAVDADVPAVQPDAGRAPEPEEPEERRAEDGADRAGSCPALQDARLGVPEPEAASPSSEAWDLPKEEGSDEAMTPSRPRTTEDLFAAIHRSKRKVLGRKDSDDDHSRSHSPSPPVTPTGAAPSLASPKQVGSIQRSIRKSSTSSDNFKALLLKKGSRSDAGARMSAAEMLKNTDPRFQRSKSEPLPDAPESPSSCSPSRSRRAQEEWARGEGLMPRSLSFSGPRYGRSRTPPSAASSRYSVRNRIQSSPMTVISEGEGETVEPADDRAHWTLGATRSCPLDGLAGDEIFEGSLLHGGEPAASLRAQSPGPADGTASAEGRSPSEQCTGPLGEES